MDRSDPDKLQSGPAVETAHTEQLGPLEERHFAMVRQATQRHKVVEKMIRRTKSAATVTLVLAVGAIGASIIWPGWENVLAATVLCGVGAVELWGYYQIRQARSWAATVLGGNQLALLAVIAAYCTVQMAAFSPEQLSSELQSQFGGLPGMQRMLDQWSPMLTYGFYGLIILISVGFQGGTARYYFRGRSHIEAFNQETPAWIRRLFVEMGQ